MQRYQAPATHRIEKTINRPILNGKKVLIHGSNRHQEYPRLGDATPKWLHLLDMRDFRQNLNHNFMRTAHYPQDPAIYDFCDRNGIIVIEEAPNIKRQKFSDEVQEQQLREMIRRDRNHPSIFFWSMGNETDDAVDSKFAVEEDSTRIIHGREIYNDSGGKYMTHTSKNLALESLLRCTIRGWYNADVRNLEPASVQQAGHETWQHDRNAREIIKRNEGRTPDDRANINTWLYEDHGADREYASSPLKHVNPRGFVDCWRTPKYLLSVAGRLCRQADGVCSSPFLAVAVPRAEEGNRGELELRRGRAEGQRPQRGHAPTSLRASQCPPLQGYSNRAGRVDGGGQKERPDGDSGHGRTSWR